MSNASPLMQVVKLANRMPAWMGSKVMSYAFTSKVKLAGTAGLKILSSDGQSATFFQSNKKKVQNHIGSIHAAGMALLAESASGFVVGANLPADKLPLMKTMELNYVKRATGGMRAVASVTQEQIDMMQQQDKGEVLVKVLVTDETGVEPVECKMLWAWVLKKRRPS